MIIHDGIAIPSLAVVSIAALFSTLEKLNLYEGALSGVMGGGMIIRQETIEAAASMLRSI